MSNQCEICGQFSSQASQKTVKLRGMDRRDEPRVAEFDVSDVFAGECCGSEILENPEAHRFDGTYQTYLNQVPDGSIGFVLLIEETDDEQPRDGSGQFAESTRAEFELPVTYYVPVVDRDLPERVREWLIGKFGELETGAVV